MKLPEWLKAKRGRKSALAAYLGVPPSFVSKMANGERPVPLEHCPYIQAFTENEVTCEEQRPDKVEYFAKIRAQSGTATTAAQPERRVSTEPNPFPDLDRRAAVQGA